MTEGHTPSPGCQAAPARTPEHLPLPLPAPRTAEGCSPRPRKIRAAGLPFFPEGRESSGAGPAVQRVPCPARGPVASIGRGRGPVAPRAAPAAGPGGPAPPGGEGYLPPPRGLGRGRQLGRLSSNLSRKKVLSTASKAPPARSPTGFPARRCCLRRWVGGRASPPPKKKNLSTRGFAGLLLSPFRR